MRIVKEWLLRCICLMACLPAGYAAIAQTADFTSTPSSGCSPLSVVFTNTSSGFSANATCNWDFGNGNRSTLKDSAGAQYEDAQDYTVTLMVTDEGNTYTKSSTITVYKKPTILFSVNTTKGCAPLPVTFTSNSTPGDGTIASYFWDYGDGAAELGAAQANHTYRSAAIVSPSLTVTNSFGCYSTVKISKLIEVTPAVNPAFAASQTVLCTVNDAITFTNNSTGEGTLSYHWDFGDNTTSTVQTPTHQYKGKGTYPVTLQVTNSEGCTADTTIPAYINVSNYNADFSVPALVCESAPAVFTDKSTPQPASYTQQLWVTDGAVNHTDTSEFSYSFTAGQHTISLIATFGTCKDTAAKTITVLAKPNTTGFVTNAQTVCGAPATIRFQDTTQGVAKWEWDFGNTADTGFVPTAFTADTSFTYTAEGIYNVRLRTTNAAGCTAEVVQPIHLQKVSAEILSSSGEYGCDTMNTVFSAISSQVIKTTTWDFGDNLPGSTEATPRHIYTKTGDYQVTLQFETVNGCTGVAYYKVHVNPRPKFDFKAIPDTVICGSNPVSFDVTGTNLDGDYYWNFGDPPGYHPGDAHTSHQYGYDSTYTVSLVITKEGCSDTITKENYIRVLPPFPHVNNVTNTCDGTRGLVSFRDESAKATRWSWDFGDRSPPYAYTTQQQNVVHTYAKTGSYTVKLTTKNGSCTATDSVVVFVLLKQSPSLSSAVTELCGSATLPVVVAGLETNPAAVYNNAYHDFDIDSAQYRDGSFFSGSYTSPDATWRDSFHVNLTDLDNTKKDLRIITTSYYFNCLDTTNYIPIKINGPKAGFEIVNNIPCYNQPLTFKDTSGSSGNADIIKWEWNFGDGATAAKINNQPFDYRYQNPGTYNVLLKVTDENGCSDTAQHNNVVVNGPQAAFDVSDNPVLPFSDITFYNQSIITDTFNYSNNQFTWLFGDGSGIKNVSLDSFPIHNYAKTSVDTVLLIATNDSTRCIDTAVQYVYVKNLDLNFTYTTEFINPGSGCPPVLATFTSTTINTTSISWNFGDGTTIVNNALPQHTYNKPGKYKVTLYGYFSDGTTDSVFQNITIQGPYATLKADREFACGAQPITLFAKSAHSTTYSWDFGDGTLTDAADTFAVHQYLTPGLYTPSLVVKDSNNCSFPYFLDKPIIIDTLHLAIGTRPAIVCDSSVVLFTPGIVSVAKEVVKVPLEYHWNFGTGNAKDTAAIEAPSFIYAKSGTYPVTLSAASPYGCAAQTNTDIIVNPTPAARIGGPLSLCQDDVGVFTGFINVNDSAVTWQWHFPNGTISTEQNPPQQPFSLPASDSVQLVVNDNGCYDTAYSPLAVFAKPVVNAQPALSILCAGQSVQLAAHDGIRYQWLPNKNIDDAAIANPTAAPDSTTLYQVTATNSKGCTSTDSVLVRVVQRFKVAATPLLYVCRGSTAQLNATGADVYNWIEGSGLNNTAIANPVTATTTPQTYKVVGYDSSHCFTDTAITELRIAGLPTVKTGAAITTFAGTPTPLVAAASPDVVQWKWLPPTYLSCAGCASPVSTPQSNIVYVVQVANSYGCTATDSISINVLCRQSLVQIPSAFTPNGDGINERFTIRGSGIKLVNRFAVFNRDGQILYDRTNMNPNSEDAGWDGTFGGKPMAPGAYVYIAEIVCATGEVYRYKNTVVLIR